MVLTRTAIPLISRAKDIIDYCQRPNFVVTIGGDQAWLHPEVPPPPNLLLEHLPNQIGYVNADRVVPVVKDRDGDVPLSLNSIYQTLPLDLDTLFQQRCTEVLIEASIRHSWLPASLTKYYSCAVYSNLDVLDLPASQTIDLKVVPSGILDLIQYFGEINKVQNATHKIRIIKQF